MKKLPPLGIVILDGNPGLRRELKRQLSEITTTPIRIIDFEDPKEAEQAFSRDQMKARMEPAVVVTDRVGTRPLKSCFAKTVRAKFPLAKVILFSGSAKPAHAWKLAFEERYIDDYLPKTKRDQIVSRVTSWYENYVRHNALGRLRAFIERCPDPETPFLPDGAGNFLSIVDAYWEVVWQTDLGHEVSATWDGLVDGWFQPNQKKHHGLRRRRSGNPT